MAELGGLVRFIIRYVVEAAGDRARLFHDVRPWTGSKHADVMRHLPVCVAVNLRVYRAWGSAGFSVCPPSNFRVTRSFEKRSAKMGISDQQQDPI